MELGIRLKAIASMVDKCESVADIGTDHGYIPIYLVQNAICSRAVASDINKGPVEKAKLNIGLENCSDKIECKLGGGLSVIKPYEVEAAIIAGMGGNLIRDIIKENIEVFRSLKFAVLQPVQNPEVLRKYIYDKGYIIIDEELCVEDNKFYEIIKVKYGTEVKKIDSIFYEVSEILIRKRHPLINNLIDLKLKRYYNILNSINDCTPSAHMRLKDVKYKIQRLKELK